MSDRCSAACGYCGMCTAEWEHGSNVVMCAKAGCQNYAEPGETMCPMCLDLYIRMLKRHAANIDDVMASIRKRP